MFFTFSSHQLILEQFYVRYYTLHTNLSEFLHSLHLSIDTPNFYCLISPTWGKYICLFQCVQCANPALMSLKVLINWFASFSMPQIDWSIHTSSYESFLIDWSDSIDSIFMSFVYYFCLFLCFPYNSLMVISTSNEISWVEMVNVQNFVVMLIKSLHQTFLGDIPLF